MKCDSKYICSVAASGDCAASSWFGASQGMGGLVYQCLLLSNEPLTPTSSGIEVSDAGYAGVGPGSGRRDKPTSSVLQAPGVERVGGALLKRLGRRGPA